MLYKFADKTHFWKCNEYKHSGNSLPLFP